MAENWKDLPDEVLEAYIKTYQQELDRRHAIRRAEIEKVTGCCYCGRPMSDKFSCPDNQWSELHVEGSGPPTKPERT